MKAIIHLPRVLLGIATLFTLIILAACSNTGTPTQTTISARTSTAASSPSPSTTQPSGPAIQITSPANSARLGIGSVTIVVKVTGFTLANKLGQPNAPGQGHIHYYMDVDPPTSADQPATTAPGTYAETSNISCVWKNIPGGEHKFSAQLVNNDHTPLSPPATAAISLQAVAETGTPTIVIASPRDGEVINGNSITLTTQVANFNPADKIGQSNAVNEGHLMFYKDVEAPTIQGPQATTIQGTYAAAAATAYTWQNLTPGVHSFSVQLVNNNNTPLNPPVSARITVTLK